VRIAHAAIHSPNRCGLYETTRDLVAAERALGIDARIVDPAPNPAYPVKDGHDRGVPVADVEWGTKADLIVSHSGHDRTPLQHTTQPVIHVSHGRPLSTFMGERGGGAPGLTYQTQKRRSRSTTSLRRATSATGCRARRRSTSSSGAARSTS
jgi:hypothetical protein